MARGPYSNYSYEKSRFGGVTGTIITHTVPGIGINNDPGTAVFKDNLPAGYLKCDGSILNAKEFLGLSRILGVGEASRYRKDGAVLREENLDEGDLGQFQLPDLGSKVFLPNTGTGIYTGDTVSNSNIGRKRVGAEIEVSSNVGDRATAGFLGNMKVDPSGALDFTGSVRFNTTLERNKFLSRTQLDIENFQAHDHSSSQNVLNVTVRHSTAGDGKGPTSNANRGNSGGGNELLDTVVNSDNSTPHRHTLQLPTVYGGSGFTYSHDEFDVPLNDALESYIDVDPNNIEKLDNVLTPFILVEYLIKF